MADSAIAYDRQELRRITGAFKAMDQEAINQAREASNALAEYAAARIKIAGRQRIKSQKAIQRVVDGVKVSKTSKIGELSFGFASQKFSGGATTQINQAKGGGKGILGGLEFGSNKYKQFPRRSPSLGKGSSGYFIYPTLRQIQPYIVRQWELAFDEIVSKY